MAAELKGVLRFEGNSAGFYCPGCKGSHHIPIKDDARAWGYNGNPDKPTFTPSILYNVGKSNPRWPLCHSFVTDGRIQYLTDSTHELAGQTVDMVPFRWDDEDETV